MSGCVQGDIYIYDSTMRPFSASVLKNNINKTHHWPQNHMNLVANSSSCWVYFRPLRYHREPTMAGFSRFPSHAMAPRCQWDMPVLWSAASSNSYAALIKAGWQGALGGLWLRGLCLNPILIFGYFREKWWYPQSSSIFRLGFSIINQASWGYPPFMKTPICEINGDSMRLWDTKGIEVPPVYQVDPNGGFQLGKWGYPFVAGWFIWKIPI